MVKSIIEGVADFFKDCPLLNAGVFRVDALGDEPQEYTDLWLMRFAADGRVDDFEEWVYWPHKPYTAED